MKDFYRLLHSDPLGTFYVAPRLSYMVFARSHNSSTNQQGKKLWTKPQISEGFTQTGNQKGEWPNAQPEVGSLRAEEVAAVSVLHLHPCLSWLGPGSSGEHIALVTLLEVEVRDGAIPAGIL